MAKNKNNQAIWNTRIQKEASNLFQKVGNSIDVDKRLYKEDIQGSIAHVEMLFRQKIISFKIKNLDNLEKVTNILFSNKRKMINKNIKKILDSRKIKKIDNLKLNLRPSEIAPDVYYKITEIYEME